MVQIHWTVSFANWAADSQLSGVRCVSAYLKDASEYVGAQIRRLQAVRFGSPSMAALRAIYLSQRDPATNLEVISCLLATYIIVRSNLLFERTGKKVVDVEKKLFGKDLSNIGGFSASVEFAGVEGRVLEMCKSGTADLELHYAPGPIPRRERPRDFRG